LERVYKKIIVKLENYTFLIATIIIITGDALRQNYDWIDKKNILISVFIYISF
jgi:hypothetical protein